MTYFLLMWNLTNYISQVMLTGVADEWPARHNWTTDQLLQHYGDVTFKISQRSSRKIKMKFKDYVSYMKIQHDEDPLYIFDEKVLVWIYLCFYNAPPTPIFLTFFFWRVWGTYFNFNFSHSLVKLHPTC